MYLIFIFILYFHLLKILIYFINKTNALKYELYTIICQIDEAGLSSIFFLDNTKKNNGIRFSILIKFFQELKNLGLKHIEYFLTDKDFSQINATQTVWPNAKIQICL